MKKILGLLLIVIAFFVTGCTPKESLSADEFKNKIEKKGFVATEQTEFVKPKNTAVEKSYKALKTDMTYSIEYYSFDGESSAQTYYNQVKNSFAETGAQAESEFNSGNYSKYTHNFKGNYGVISRVSNTVIYVNANNIYSEEIKSILKDIGY